MCLSGSLGWEGVCVSVSVRLCVCVCVCVCEGVINQTLVGASLSKICSHHDPKQDVFNMSSEERKYINIFFFVLKNLIY